MNFDRLITLKVLQQEISVLRTKIMPEDSGHIYTAISVIKDRIQELEQTLTPEEQTWYVLNAN
jgi:hypothetical protein